MRRSATAWPPRKSRAAISRAWASDRRTELTGTRARLRLPMTATGRPAASRRSVTCPPRTTASPKCCWYRSQVKRGPRAGSVLASAMSDGITKSAASGPVRA